MLAIRVGRCVPWFCTVLSHLQWIPFLPQYRVTLERLHIRISYHFRTFRPYGRSCLCLCLRNQFTTVSMTLLFAITVVALYQVSSQLHCVKTVVVAQYRVIILCPAQLSPCNHHKANVWTAMQSTLPTVQRTSNANLKETEYPTTDASHYEASQTSRRSESRPH